MATLGVWKLICQWGSGKIEEIRQSLTTAVPAQFTVVGSGTGFPTMPTGTALGSNCMQYEETGGGGAWYGLVPTHGKYDAGGSPTGGSLLCGFFWRPKTNPTGGTYSRIGIINTDSGSGGGFTLSWKSNKKLAIWDTYGFSEFYETTVTADTAESYGGITNPPYYIAIKADSGLIGFRIYKWKNDTATWGTPVEEWTSISYTSSPGATQFINFGSNNMGSPSGAWYLANLFIIKTGGLWGPAGGCSMASGTVDAGVVPVTNHASWRANGGEADNTTAESDDIAELSPDDTDYLKNTGTTPGVQYRSVVNGILGGTAPNVHAVQVSTRCTVVNGTNSLAQTLNLRQSGAAGFAVSTGARTITHGASGAGTWTHDWLCSEFVYDTAALTPLPWTETLVDALEIGFAGIAATTTREFRWSHAMATVAYGTAETVTTTRTAQTQVN